MARDTDWAEETLEIERHRLLGERRHMQSMAVYYLDERIEPSANDDAKLKSIERALTLVRGLDE